MDPEFLARELHEVAFAWNHNMPEWDSLRDEDRQWFTERAGRMLATEEHVETDGTAARRLVRGTHPPSMRFTVEEAEEAVRSAAVMDNYRKACNE
jgi:hypothetical protein